MTEAAPIHYRILPKDPAGHVFEVSCTIAQPDAYGQQLSMPAWIPGSYMIRDFARNVVRLWAHCGDEAVKVEKLDKQTWRCEPCQGPLTITYEVYAWDLSVRAAHLDTTHGYFNGTSVFLCADGQQDKPCTVEILPPEGEAYKDWRLATAMTEAGAERYGFGTYRAADYDELVDHPVEMGTFTLATFEACGVPHDIVLTGRHRADMDRLCADLKTICEQHIRFFGEPAPMDRYVFMALVVGDGYGGLEHRASTSLICSRDSLPRAGMEKISDEYRTFLGLCSHEYFHTWNVKRIKPEVFTPYELGRESHTQLLWAFEGITSYYDDLGLVRSGVVTPESYLELLGQTMTRVFRGSGRLKQSVAESSFDAWTKFYKQDENAPNAIVSYYTKGAMVALALDLTLRQHTHGEKSLDDVMATLWQRYGQAGEGVPEEGVEAVAAEIAGSDLSDFFEQAVRGTEDLPWARLLEGVGVALALRPAESASDKGGKAASKGDEQLARQGDLGVRIAGNGEAKLAYVREGGAAHRAGLAAGDVLVAIDGIKATSGNAEKLAAGYAPGTPVSVHAFRRDELMRFDVTVQAPPPDTCVLSLLQDVSADVQQRRDDWLGLKGSAG